MNLLQAIILGIVQGLTEFIPISSTAHMVFAIRWTGIYDGNPQQITATMAVIQLGTLAAVIVYFATDIWKIAVAFLRDNRKLISQKKNSENTDAENVGRRIGYSNDAWLGWLIILGSIPIGVIGLLFKDQIEGETTKNLWTISMMLIAGSVLLFIAEKVGSMRKDIEHLGIIDAVIVGFSQCLALIPGASRSGSTIMGGLFAGEKRETAARFSFLLSIPAITASGLLELREAYRIIPLEDFIPLFAATLTAGIVGYLCIWFLLSFLRNHSTMVFIVYRVVLAVLIILGLSQGIIQP